jgi:putative zinc finger/helix-turn-helix YgiT family protein
MENSRAKLCPMCGARERRPATIDYRTRIRLDRRMIDVHVPALPVEECGACGERFFGNVSDRMIDDALRSSAGLLTSSQLESARQELGIGTQQELAELIGVAPASLSRWMKGHVVQGRLADTMLRVFFGVPEARAFLRALRREGVAARPIVVPDQASLAPSALWWASEPRRPRHAGGGQGDGSEGLAA